MIDDRIAFVGGIDFTSEAGDRFDSADHPARAAIGWHDACALIEGPAVQDVADHFRSPLAGSHERDTATAAARGSGGETELQIVRTVPEHVYRGLPRGDFGILESYGRALRSARRLIYLENQFLWSSEIEAVLVDKLRRPPHPDFRLLVVLPARPNNGSDDTRGMLGELIEADDDNGRLLACTLYARSGNLFDPIYVHAKIGIVDDAWLTIGSANLNEHSLFNDTEMNVVTHDEDIAARHQIASVGRASRAPGEHDPCGPHPRDRRALEADQRGSAQAARRELAPHPPAGAPAERLAALGPRPRPAERPARRRLSRLARAVWRYLNLK